MIGRHISHFYVIRLLGSGGMGVVYEAQDTRLPRSVALKFLKAGMAKETDAVRRFKREARLASSLNHPNICTILDVEDGDEQSFIAMELLKGKSLKARLVGEPLPLGEILDITGQVADALAAAHDQGIIHRDIAPGNVFLTDGGLVKLLDFGLAKHFPTHAEDGQTTDDLTATGVVVGTLYYMAPEQLAEDGSIDYRCDLFSLGAIVYQMATGARPFDISPKRELIAAIQRQQHVPLRQLAPQNPLELERIVDRLLAKRPEDRYQGARALRADLDALRRSTQTSTSSTSATGDIERGRPSSMAVLPFEIIGNSDPVSLQFRDGLAEDTFSRLSALRDLRVAPRTSTRNAAGKSIREIGKALGVELVLEGTIQYIADRVRVTANLVYAAHERSVVPALRIERQFDDLLVTQDVIAGEIVDGLTPALSRAPGRRHRREPEAHHAFLRGQHHWRSCFAGGWRQAIEHFQYAIERDSRFALAHVALANAYNFLGFYCLMKPNLAFDVAARAAASALAIDDTLGSAHVEIALAKFGGDWDWEGCESAFRRAIAIDADDPFAHVYYSWLLILLGREDAALSEAQKGHALRPTSRLVTASRAQTLYIGGHYDEAVALCTECIRVDPEYVFAVHLRGLCHLTNAKFPEAIADLERAADLSHRVAYYLGMLGRAYGQCGRRDDALALIAELGEQTRETYVPPQSYVYIYAGLGERDRALEYQEKAYEDGASPFNYLAPTIRDLYALDPYHKGRLQQMRLAL
jgi:serine/threonine protein kinase/tetratricopeptide (TPR) repeat protein